MLGGQVWKNAEDLISPQMSLSLVAFGLAFLYLQCYVQPSCEEVARGLGSRSGQDPILILPYNIPLVKGPGFEYTLSTQDPEDPCMKEDVFHWSSIRWSK